MSLSRFHLAPSFWASDALVLTGDEAAHCVRVQRHQVGDTVEVGDGDGRVAEAVLTAISKTVVQLRITVVHQHKRPSHAIHLLPALIKAEPFEWLLEKAVELGAASIRPVITERTVVHLAGEQLDKKLAKWQRLMIESAKQCHTSFVPELHPPQALTTALRDLPADALKLIPALSEQTRTLKDVLLPDITCAYVAIGPEGDFTTQEEALAIQHGFRPVTLGPLVLRAETAGIAVLAILGHEMR